MALRPNEIIRMRTTGAICARVTVDTPTPTVKESLDAAFLHGNQSQHLCTAHRFDGLPT